MLVITSISRGLSVGWVVDRMPGLSIVYVSIGQLVEWNWEPWVWVEDGPGPSWEPWV